MRGVLSSVPRLWLADQASQALPQSLIVLGRDARHVGAMWRCVTWQSEPQRSRVIFIPEIRRSICKRPVYI